MRRSDIPSYGHDHRVRVVFGPQDDAFTDEGRHTFIASVYTMTPQSDRIGCRFDGPVIAHRTTADIVSDGTTLGNIQVSGDGMPIVLMADRGTTGGYTKIATVISADIWRLAQAAPGDRVSFDAVELDEACARLREQEAVLDALVAPATPHENAPADDLYDEDAGGGWAAEGFGDLADALNQTGWGRDQ
jgi:antagonist of KipI